MRLLRACLIVASLVASRTVAFTEDWPEYRGAAGDGLSTEKLNWPAGGPKRLWTVDTPAGFSSLAVGNGRVFTLIARMVDGTPLTMCVALDANTGKELWAQPTGVAKFQPGGDRGAEGNNGGDGPRSTPAANEDRVWVYSQDMTLYCLEAATGHLLWKKEIAKEFSGRNIGWKSAMSPVIDGDLVYVAGGGKGESMLAFKKASGELAWKCGDETMTHATPVVATIHGVRQVIYFMQSGLVSANASTGELLWKFRFPYQTATACSPVVAGDVVFCTAGYEIGGSVCQVLKTATGFETKELWRARGNSPAASLWSTPVERDGFLYGMISYKEFANGPLKCIDLKNGMLKWQQAGFGTGNVLLVDKYLVALADDGKVVVVEASPEGYKEIGRFKAVTGKCWSNPAWSRGRLYVRSTKEGACFDFTSNN
jgi:outer membrane protein assembly factor BamB